MLELEEYILSRTQVLELDEVDSTNAYVTRLIAESALPGKACRPFFANSIDGASTVAPPLLCWAKRQTCGVGRLGRKWEGGVGNIMMSIVVHEGYIPPGLMGVVPCVVPLAVVDSIYFRDSRKRPLLNEAKDGFRLRVKWPNDVYINLHKVCGVLIQKWGAYYVLGIGVNVAVAPAHIPVKIIDRAGGILVQDGAGSLAQYGLFADAYGVYCAFVSLISGVVGVEDVRSRLLCAMDLLQPLVYRGKLVYIDRLGEGLEAYLRDEESGQVFCIPPGELIE